MHGYNSASPKDVQVYWDWFYKHRTYNPLCTFDLANLFSDEQYNPDTLRHIVYDLLSKIIEQNRALGLIGIDTDEVHGIIDGANPLRNKHDLLIDKIRILAEDLQYHIKHNSELEEVLKRNLKLERLNN